MMKTGTLPKAKILLVDDRPENLFSLRKIIEAEDREIICAESGQEALRLALKHHFALILSDVQMPEMNGFEMLEILRMDERNIKIPVIFVTANSKEEKYVMKGYSEGAVDYLFKPLNVDIVRAKVDVFTALYQQKVLLESQAKTMENLNEEKNKFLGMAAHDLRNPIGVIQHFSNFLLEDVSSKVSSEELGYIDMIKSASNLMMNLVDELLDISKIESGSFEINKEATDVNKLIDSAIGINRIFAERKETKILMDVQDDLPQLMMDPMKVNLVLNNLIGNAIKYSQNGATIQVNSFMQDGQLEIRVKDNGPGIAKEDQEKLFDAFSTTSNKTTGGEKSTGLGLLIVSKVVEAHDGTIGVESEIGNGSEFIVKLNLDAVTNNVTNQTAVQDAQNNEMTVLYVDDDIMFHEISKRIFKDFNVNLKIANNGAEAMDILQEDDSISMVFTDINMPVMNGYELAKDIRTYLVNDITIVGLSGTVNDDVSAKAIESGMDLCYQKPISKGYLQMLFDDVAVA